MRYLTNPLSIPARRFVTVVIFLIGISGCSGEGGGSGPPANQAPVAFNSCEYDSGVNQPFNGTLVATDPEGQSLTYSIVGIASNGSAQVTNPLTGAFTYTPNTNTRGTDTFTFRACEAAPSTVCSNVATYKIVHTPRIMPLGDSITEGDGSGDPDNLLVGYRKPLKEALTAAGYVTDFVGTQNSGSSLFTDSEHEGHGGFTADQINGSNGSFLTNLLNNTASMPDVVLLHIGTNDISTSGGFNIIDVNDVENILDTIDSWEASNWPVTVVISRIITNQQFEPSVTTSFNDAVKTMVLGRTTDLLEWVDHQANVSVTTDYSDLLHPNTNGYQKMTDVWRYPLTGSGTASGNHSGPGILPKCP